MHEQVFEVERRLGQERGIGHEVGRIGFDAAVDFADEQLVEGALAKRVIEQTLFGVFIRTGQLLELGESVDQGQKGRAICDLYGAYVHGAVF
jgi:hypothetical protein